MTELTSESGAKAIVYVDDFSGSGKQFMRSRNWIAQFIEGAYTEFFLVVCICEEAKVKIEKKGVVPMAGLVHLRSERPLHQEGKILSEQDRLSLRKLCVDTYGKPGLGFKKMATSVVLERNAPNQTPLLLRGNLGQDPYFGVLPRWDDKPVPRN